MDKGEQQFVAFALQHPAAHDLIAAVRDSGAAPTDLGRAFMSATNLLSTNNQLEPALILWKEANHHLTPEHEQLG
jgi:hypothetical protein